jgi:hypothetical protein
MSNAMTLQERPATVPCPPAAPRARADTKEHEMMEAWELVSRSLSGIGEPIATVIMYCGPVEEQASPPGPHRQWLGRCGWLVCDGSRLPLYDTDGSPSIYWRLFAAIGSAYGGDETSFQLPDYRDYFPERGIYCIPLIKFTHMVGIPDISLSHLLGTAASS